MKQTDVITNLIETQTDTVVEKLAYATGLPPDEASTYLGDIWEKRDQYTDIGHNPLTWVETVARNAHTDALRRQRRQKRGGDTITVPLDESINVPETYTIIPGSDKHIEALNVETNLHAFLSSLSPQIASVYEGVQAGATQEEISQQLNIPLNTAKTRIYRFRQEARKFLSINDTD